MAWLENGTPSSVSDAFVNNKVAWHPQPNSLRINPRYRMLPGAGLPCAMAQRHLMRILPNGGVEGEIFNGWLDVVPISDDVLEGSTGLSPEGYELQLQVIDYGLVLDPVSLSHGIVMLWTFSKTGETPFFVRYIRRAPLYPGQNGVTPNMIELFGVKLPAPFITTDFDPLIHTWWTNEPSEQYYEWTTMSECWQFPEPPIEDGFAEFNGVDAYLSITPDSIAFSGVWKWEFDIRIRSFLNCWPLQSGSLWHVRGGVDATNVVIQNNGVPHGGAITLDTWHHVVLQRGWGPAVSGLSELFVDDTFIADNMTNNTGGPFHYMGGNAPQGRGNWGDFDLRYMLIQTDNGDILTVLDMDLTIDACDDSPQQMVGTTFNMDLLSCVP